MDVHRLNPTQPTGLLRLRCPLSFLPDSSMDRKKENKWEMCSIMGTSSKDIFHGMNEYFFKIDCLKLVSFSSYCGHHKFNVQQQRSSLLSLFPCIVPSLYQHEDNNEFHCCCIVKCVICVVLRSHFFLFTSRIILFFTENVLLVFTILAIWSSQQ